MTIEFFHKTKNDRNTIFGFYVTIFYYYIRRRNCEIFFNIKNFCILDHTQAQTKKKERKHYVDYWTSKLKWWKKKKTFFWLPSNCSRNPTGEWEEDLCKQVVYVCKENDHIFKTSNNQQKKLKKISRKNEEDKRLKPTSQKKEERNEWIKMKATMYNSMLVFE